MALYEKITAEVAKILTDRFPSKNKDIEAHGKHYFFGRRKLFRPRDLVYLVLEAERHFGVTLSEEGIVSGKLATFDGFCKEIFNEVEGKG